MKTPITIDTAEERDTILAALRYWQAAGANGDDVGDDLREIMTNGGKHEGMNDAAIDELCERINIGTPDEEPAQDPAPETLVQFCDRMMTENDHYLSGDGPAPTEEWHRARKLMLHAVAFVEQMARFESPDDGEDESEMDAWEAMIVKARDIAGIPRAEATRENLLKERNGLLRQGSTNVDARANDLERIAEIDRELMLSEGDIRYLNDNPSIIDPDDMPF